MKVLKGLDRIATGEEIVDNLKAIVFDYFEERFGNTVIAFGNAGSRVLRNVTPFEAGNTNFHAIKIGPADSASRASGSRKAGKTTSGTKFYKVELANKGKDTGDTHYKKGNPTPFSINEILVNREQFNSSPDLLARAVFNEIPRSMSFILVSGFGGEFAQKMHIAFSEMLKEKRIAHVNIVIVPSKTEAERRKSAYAGLSELRRKCGDPKVYDNEEMMQTKTFDSADSMAEFERVNQIISRKLHVVSLGLSERAGIMRSGFLGE